MLNSSPKTLASVLLPFLLTAVPAGASGQDTTFIADAPACSSCSLELEHLASISSSDEVHVYSTGLFVETPSHYVLSHTYEQETLHLFDKDGDFVRSVGRAGDGPGEYRRIWGLDVASDSLFVFDGGLRRLTVLDGDYEVVASEDFPPIMLFRNGFWRFADGDIVLNGMVQTRDRIGFPLHLARVGAGLQRSFGTDTPSFDGSQRPHLRKVTRAGQGGIWSVQGFSYTIERWDQNGDRTAVLHRRAPWFERERYDPEDRPEEHGWEAVDAYARVMDVVEDDAGMLRVLLQVPDPDADPAMAEQVGGIFPLYDSVIEIIDPVEGEVISRTKVDAFLGSFLGPDKVTSVADDDLTGRMEVWRLES